MKELLLNLLTIAFGATGVISLLAYWPTIKDLHHHKKPSANTSSYALWTGTSGISFLYVIFIVPDLLLIVVNGMTFSACTVVLILSIRLSNHT